VHAAKHQGRPDRSEGHSSDHSSHKGSSEENKLAASGRRVVRAAKHQGRSDRSEGHSSDHSSSNRSNDDSSSEEEGMAGSGSGRRLAHAAQRPQKRR
jgi:hypothetical protein